MDHQLHDLCLDARKSPCLTDIRLHPQILVEDTTVRGERYTIEFVEECLPNEWSRSTEMEHVCWWQRSLPSRFCQGLLQESPMLSVNVYNSGYEERGRPGVFLGSPGSPDQSRPEITAKLRLASSQGDSMGREYRRAHEHSEDTRSQEQRQDAFSHATRQR